MRRALVRGMAAAAAFAAGLPWSASAVEPERHPGRVGVLMLHGKNPGSAQDPRLAPIMLRLQHEGFTVLRPDLPWSRHRYLDGDWDQAMQEIGRHVAALRETGATQIALVGHSMGVPASLSYAARHQNVDALVLFAPGHAPRSYYHHPPLAAVRNSIDEARAMVAAGRGGERATFHDVNQGRALLVDTTARAYLSYFDPTSDADMAISAPRVPARIPVLTVIGHQDPLFALARTYFADRLPAHPKTRYLEVAADHLGAPAVGIDAAIAWLREVFARP